MASIIPLKDSTGAQFYPQTHEKAVVDSNGVNLQTKLQSISAPSYVVAWDGDSTPVVANIPAGVTFTYGGNTYTGTLAASSSTTNKTYLVGDNNGNFDEYVTQVNGSTYSWQYLGNTEIDLSDYATKDELNQLEAEIDGFFLYSPNLYNKDDADCVNGKFVQYINGQLANSTTLKASGWIPVIPGKKYISNYGGQSAFYDLNKVYISGVSASNVAFTAPDNSAYIRVSFKIDQDATNRLNQSETLLAYAPYYRFVNPERMDADQYVVPKTGKNKFNGEDLLNGHYIALNGVEGEGATSLSLSTMMPIKPSTAYHFSDKDGNGVGNSSALHQFFDANRSVIGTIPSTDTDFTTPANAAYIRATVRNDALEIQLEEGTVRTEYEPYNKIGGYLDGASIKVAPPSFGTFRNRGSLANGATLTLPKIHIVKNMLLSGSIEGTIDANGVEVGVGFVPGGATKDYDARWLLITNTTVQLYWNRNSGDLPINPLLNHGLTLTSLTHFSVEVTVTNDAYTATFRLANDLGDVYTVNIMNYVANGWGVGMPFVKNLCASPVTASLSFAPRDITKRVWCFGDSCFSFLNNSRWPYYAKAAGNIGWFSNNQGGLAPESAYGDLVNMLSLGYTPTYLLWCLGMNGDTAETQEVGQYVINDYQKTWIDAVISLCEKKHIIPVLGVVPTVPTRQKTGFGNYVKSLGVRYVDFAKAVGATSAGVWNTGLLSSDGVHPSEAGGKVLYSQVLVDFPEISINE